jgi:hypothetical protein
MNTSKLSALFANVNLRAVIIGLSVIVSTAILCSAILRVGLSGRQVSVTGLGETEMQSDWIAWQGTIVADAASRADCYRKLEQDRKAVAAYLTAQGVAEKDYDFFAITIDDLYDDAYSADGRYIGRRFKGYRMRQTFEIQSADIDRIEAVSRDITSLISDGINVESGSPKFYLRDLQSLKLSLIDDATANALVRAEKLIKGFARIKDIKSIDVGVFQVTGLYGNDEYSYGGTFNTSDRMKKVSVTVHATYGIR